MSMVTGLASQTRLRSGACSLIASAAKRALPSRNNRLALAPSHCRQLDPELQLYSGRQYPPNSQRSNFGLFLDSPPDRWGRMLMQPRAAHQAWLEGRKPIRLMDRAIAWELMTSNG
ncbi:MAG TPA: hypothetical protein DDZ51_31100 [Planctomycetaceae bacterium]|nr:hypothetical protein [Planctomycetaceae bacterium]